MPSREWWDTQSHLPRAWKPRAGRYRARATVATAFGCPFEGRIDEDRVVGIVDTYREMGIEGITLADTTGMANPRQVTRLVDARARTAARRALTLHFHNTRGLGLANVLAAYEAGARRFDAALGGLAVVRSRRVHPATSARKTS